MANWRGEELLRVPDVERVKIGILSVVTGRQGNLHDRLDIAE